MQDPNNINIYDELMNDSLNTKSSSPSDDFASIYDEMMNDSSDPFSSQMNLKSGDIGDENYLTEFDDAFKEGVDLDEQAAQRQSWGSKFTSGLGRVGAKIISEVAKMPGVLGGIVAGGVGQIDDAISGEDNTDFIKTAFNNSWIQSITEAEEYVKDEFLPVHVKKAVSEGNLWDNITSIDFWATEGADGIGYIASMLAPGAAINKFGLGSKLLGVNKYNKMLSKLDDAEKHMSKAYRMSNKQADLYTSTVANTLFEAGAEAKGAMDGYIDSLNYRMSLPEGHPDKLTMEQFEIESQKESSIGANVFTTNAAILLGPNAIMSKMLWGKPSNKMAKSFFSKNKPSSIKNATSKSVGDKVQLNKIDTPKLKTKLKEVGIDLAKATGREGFFEEGFQSAAETYFTENPDNTFYDFVKGDFVPSYLDMLNTTDGQKAIFLGSFLGGGMQAYTGAKSRKKDRNNANDLIDSANKTLDSFYDLFQHSSYETKDGVIQYEDTFDKKTGKKVSTPKLDYGKIFAKLNGMNGIEKLSAQYDLALAQGDMNTIDKIQDTLTTHLVTPFIVNDNLGIDVLKQHLNSSKQLLNLPKESEKSKDDFINDIIDKATYLQKEYTKFQDIAPNVMKLENENALKEDASLFYNKHSIQYVNLHSQKRTSLNKVKKSEELLKDALDNESHYDTSLYFDEKAYRDRANDKDIRLNKLYSDYSINNDVVKEIDLKLSEFWNNDKVNSKFNKFVSDQNNIRKQIEEKEGAYTEAVELINNSASSNELNDVISNIKHDDILNNDEIKNIISKKKDSLKAKESEEDKELKESNDAFIEQQNESTDESAKYLNHLKKYFKVGDEITIPYELSPELEGEVVKINKINKKSLSVELKDGSKKNIKIKNFVDSFNNQYEYNTEGGENNIQEKIYDKESGNIFEEKNQPRIVITNNQKRDKNKKLSFTSDEALAYEQNPVNKVGDRKGLEVNKEGFSDNQKRALEMFNSNDFSDINFLIDNLPLNIKLTDSITAPLETQTKGSQEVFNKTSKPLRTTIIKELANGTNIEDITVEIAGQWNGDLQLSPNKDNLAAENNIKDLFKFDGETSNISQRDLFVVNEYGELINTKGEILHSNRPLAPGEVYIKIEMANGKLFPLKLNIKKINVDEANLLYELYSYRLDNLKEGKGIRISSLPTELQEKIDATFNKEIELFEKNKKNKNDLTIKDIIDTLIWDGTKSKKTQVRFNNGRLLVGNKSYSKEEFLQDESKEEFINFLTTEKRRNIKFKRRGKNQGINSLNLENRNYLNYLIDNAILNTNAVVNEPTFQGQTTMYLNKRTVKVKNRTSKFNKDIKKTFRKNLLGSNKDLHNKLPNLNKNIVTLSSDGSHYVDTKGNKYNRVSSLKDSNINIDKLNVFNAAKRGNVVDLLTRDFFNKDITLSDFIKNGDKYLSSENKKSDNRSTVIMSEDYYTQLYNILEQYKIEFDKRDYTIYSTSNALSGNISTKGLIAGTVDLLVYDNINKEWVIIDLKTSTQDRGDAYDNPNNDRYGYRKKDSIQQLTYSELFFQKNGIKPSKLLIMPLISKASNKDNSEYNDISISNSGLFLEIDTSKDIYEILNIKDAPASSEKTNKFNVDNVDDQSVNNEGVKSIDMMSKFGFTIKETKPIPKPKITQNQSKFIPTKEQLASISKSLGDNTLKKFEHNGMEYRITDDTYYILNISNNTIVDTYDGIMSIFRQYNKTQPELYHYDLKRLEHLWTERLKGNKKQSVVSQHTKQQSTPQTKYNIDSFTEHQATDMLKALYVAYAKQYGKDINIVNRKYSGSTNKIKLKALLSLLENKGLSKDNIQIKCGL